MENHTNINLKKLLASAALEDEELSIKLSNEGADKFALQKIEWKADEKVGGFERELVIGCLCVEESLSSCTGTVFLKQPFFWIIYST